MNRIKLGVIREGKVPPDKRVPLTPQQCQLVKTKFPLVDVVVQKSAVRAFKDEEYSDLGIPVVDSLEDCDIIVGVKEVNIEDLIPGKKFLFFSHTIKKQPYNRKLLQAVMDKRIQLIDYEVLKNKQNKRIIGFGRYAGIVGCYNGFLAYGKKHGYYDILPANACRDRVEMEEEMKKIELPNDTKIVLTGFGRVGYGAREIMDLLPITEVSPEEFLTQTFDGPVFTHLDVEDYYARIDGTPFEKADFYANPNLYKSVFAPYLHAANLYIACHFWSNRSPFIITQEELKDPKTKTSVVADISCDIQGPIGCTIRPSVIANPVYGYNPETGEESDPWQKESIAVMAVDNLPCELPLDASEDFGNELIKHVLPCLFGEDPDDVIGRASETDLNGKLTPHFAYLQDYVDGNKVSQ
jgi:saccharopine dehydrogenase (NAD+, L-lysine-forming)